MIPEVSNPDKQDHCEQCEYFRRIDSGFGYCTRNPPRFVLRYLPWHLFIKIPYMVCEYPDVPWDGVPCGEFLRKSRKKYG